MHIRYGDKYFHSKMIKIVNQVADHFKCRALLLMVRDRLNGKFVSSYVFPLYVIVLPKLIWLHKL